MEALSRLRTAFKEGLNLIGEKNSIRMKSLFFS